MDTLAGVMGVDPPRFGRRARGRAAGGDGLGRGDHEDEREAALAFLKGWKPFDWTSELDGTWRRAASVLHGGTAG